MAHFSKDNPGVKKKISNTSTPRGFISNQEIQKLINVDNCVGIRVYNIQIEKNTNLIFCAVDEAGNEIGDTYFFNDLNSKGSLTGETFSRSTALSFGKSSEFSTRFVSFFSIVMLNILMMDERFSGIAFYDSEIDLPFRSGKMSFATHLGVPAKKESGKVIADSSSDDVRGLLSDCPCPGHCVNFEDENDLSSKRSTTAEALQTDGIYIIRWR